MIEKIYLVSVKKIYFCPVEVKRFKTLKRLYRDRESERERNSVKHDNKIT